jgi:outer membrane protein TolC
MTRRSFAAFPRSGALLVLTLGLAWAEEPLRVPERLSLREALRLAANHNKAIQAAQQQAAANRHRVTTARGAFDPFAYGETGWVDEDSTGTDAAEGRFEAGVEKRFLTGTEVGVSSSWLYTDDRDSGVGATNPLHDAAGAITVSQDLLRNFGPGVNGTGIRVAENTWQASREEVRDTLIWNLYQVEQVYWQIHYAEADLRVRHEQLARAQRLVEVAEAQVRVGEAAPIEITRARSSAASQEVSILSAENDLSLLRNRLLRLLGVIREGNLAQPFELADVPPPVAAPPSLEQSLAIARERRPDCRQAALALASAEAETDYARNQTLPALRLFAGVGVAGEDGGFGGSVADAGRGDETIWEVGIRAEFPLGNQVAKGRHGTARALRFRAAIQQRDILEQALREVADASDTLAVSVRKTETARRSRELAEELLVAEEKSFKLGRSTSLDVLNAQQALAQAEREEVRAAVAYATALGNLHAVRGDYLEVKQIPLPEPDEE